jgi:hypothetical protein
LVDLLFARKQPKKAFPCLPAGREPPKKPTNNGFDKSFDPELRTEGLTIKRKVPFWAALVLSCSAGRIRTYNQLLTLYPILSYGVDYIFALA